VEVVVEQTQLLQILDLMEASGIIIVRSPTGAPLSVAPCTNTVSCVCGATVATFTVSGTLTVN
jgi:hypothetical protein